MPPQNTGQPSPLGPQSDYQFIFNEPKPPSFQPSKMVIVLGILGLLLIVVIGASVILSSGKKDYKKQLLDLMASQQELIRVAKTSQDQANLTSNTKATVANTLGVVRSDENQIKLYYTSHINKKIDTKLLSAHLNKATDADLANAAQSGHYEDELIKVLGKQFQDYQKGLKTDYALVASKTLKTDMTTAYENNKLILGLLGIKDATSIEDTTQNAVTNALPQ